MPNILRTISAALPLTIYLICSVAIAGTYEYKSIDKGTIFDFHIKGEKLFATTKGSGKLMSISPELRSMLRASEEWVWLQEAKSSNNTLFLIMIHSPSKPGSRGRGYCGAGYEDDLLLIEERDRNIRLLDAYNVQSCLRSVSIDTSQSTDEVAKLMKPNQDGSFSFATVSSENYASITVKIVEKKLKILKEIDPE